MKLDLAAYRHSLLSFLLIFRWISLAPTLWLFSSSIGPIAPSTTSLRLLAITTGFTLLITLFHYFNHPVLAKPYFLGVDLLFIAILLALSGAGYSVYSFYALSPLLAGAFFFRRRGLLWAASTFTVFYLLALLLIGDISTSTIRLSALFIQLTGLWLIPFLFAYPLTLLNNLAQTHETLLATHYDLRQQNIELTTTHQQLELIHELTMFLQGALDIESVQRRLLKVVTRDLNFSRGVVGLVNPILQRLEGWQAHPLLTNPPLTAIPLPLAPEKGLIAQAVLGKQISWCSPEEQLVTDEMMRMWFGNENWLILPIVWEEKTLGVLLVVVDTVGPVDIADDRWPILTALVSQAALALGTIDRTKRLVVEKERNRIARDIHDTVTQSLFGIAFTLDACIKLLPDHVQMVRQEMVELKALADRVRQEVRQSILDIWPSGLTEEKFKADLCKYVIHSSPDRVFHIKFKVNGDFDGLSSVIRRSLYRVSQEALLNSARHAGVDSARVYLYVEAEEVHLSIRDKGRGFDPKLVLARERNRERFGLRGMQERILALRGTCDILSQAGQGTQVLVRVPIDQGNGHG